MTIVVSENSVRGGNAEVMIFVEIVLAPTMVAVLVAFFALVTSTFQSRAGPNSPGTHNSCR